MKNEQFIKSTTNKLMCALVALASLGMLAGCDDDDPEKENIPELITKATLTFTPDDGGAAVVATATDPDGEGLQDLTVDQAITLATSKTYVLTITLVNELADQGDAEYNITEEVEEEGDEHIFFFSWTNNVFADPTGNGNIDNRNDPVNYTGGSNSLDDDNLPLGLTTTWQSASSSAEGNFRVLLKHQPDLKSDTSDSSTGETDVDITFDIEVL